MKSLLVERRRKAFLGTQRGLRGLRGRQDSGELGTAAWTEGRSQHLLLYPLGRLLGFRRTVGNFLQHIKKETSMLQNPRQVRVPL